MSNTSNSYLWNTGATTNSINVSFGGTYTVTITDIDGCTSLTDTIVNMLSNPPPNLTATSMSFCEGDSMQVTATGLAGATFQWSGGLPSVSNPWISSSGLYTVTVTQPNGCTREADTTFTELVVIPITFSGTLSVCQGDSAEIHADGYISWLWSTGSTINPLKTNIPGTYTVTVTDANNCKATDSITVQVFNNPAPILTTAPFSPSFCQGDSLLVVLDSTYSTITWSVSSVTDSSIYVTSGGWIVVTVTDINTCSAKDSIDITENPSPPIPLGDTTYICDGNTLTLTAGPPGTYNYLWNDNSTSNTIIVSSAGTYSVTVTNPTTNCSSKGSELINVNIKPIATITKPIKICEGDTIFLVGNSGNFNYSWSPPTGTNDSLQVDTSGTYQLIIEDQITTCRDTESIAIIFYPLPLFSIEGDSIICVGDIVPISSSNSYPLYDWNTPMGGYTDSSISVNTPGNYFLTVTDTNLCVATKSFSLTVIPLPTPTITGDSTICAGLGSVLNSGYPNLSNLWSTGDTNNTIYVYQQGNYSVTIIDQYGCTGTDQQLITVNQLPLFSIVPNTSGAICAGDSVTLSTNPSGFVSYQWSNSSTNNSINVGTSGNFLATVTDANGCQNTDNYNLIVHPSPVPIIFATDSSCEGQVEQLSVQTGFLSYQWTPTGSTLNAINVTNSGTYSVFVVDTNYCTADTSISIVFHPLPVVSITGDFEFCTNDSTILTVNNPNSIYLWSDGSTSSAITASTGGLYQVTVNNIHGCSASDITLIIEHPLPQPVITGDDTICEGFSSQLQTGNYLYYQWSNSLTSNPILVSQTGSYQVTVIDTNFCTNTSPSFPVVVLPAYAEVSADGPLNLCPGESVTLTANNGQAYLWSNGNTSQTIAIDSTTTLNVTVTNLNGCVAVSAPIQINSRSNPKVIVYVIDSLICGTGYMAQFIDNSICEPGSYYAWNFGDGDTSSVFSPIHYYQQTATYNPILTITSPYGCESDTFLVIDATYNPPAIADFVVNTEIESIIGDPIEFRSLAINAVSIEWNFDDSKDSVIKNVDVIKHSYCDDGDHYPKLIAKNIDGCIVSKEKQIHISPFFLENAFTPNDDRINEGFIQFDKPENLLSYDFNVYSRWASLIFSTNDPNIYWKGEDKNITQNEGVYVYTLEMTNLAGCPVYTNSAPNRESKIPTMKAKRYVGIVNVVR